MDVTYFAVEIIDGWYFAVEIIGGWYFAVEKWDLISFFQTSPCHWKMSMQVRLK